MATGIRKLHSKGCPGRDGGRCRCGGGWEASVYSKRDDKKIRKTFANKAEAKTWRDDTSTMLAKGGLRAPKPTTVGEAWEPWHAGARTGAIRASGGALYKPGTLRAYEKGMRLRVLPVLAGERLADLQRPDVQRLIHELQADGLGASTIRTTIAAVRAICRHAVDRGDLVANPCSGVKLPTPGKRTTRIADPAEAAALIAAVPDRDRPLWATAMYAGLRRGELQALRWSDVDLAAGVIHVERGWDEVAGEQETKGRNRRRVPVVAILRDHLLEHRLRHGGEVGDLVFGRMADVPFTPNAVTKRADRVWLAAGLQRIVLHDCRHTFVSLLAAAHVDVVAISRYAGHADVGFTLNRYAHLFEGSEAQAAELLGAYLQVGEERAAARARGATGELTGELESETA